MIEDLQADQEERKKIQPEIYEKLNQSLIKSILLLIVNQILYH